MGRGENWSEVAMSKVKEVAVDETGSNFDAFVDEGGLLVEEEDSIVIDNLLHTPPKMRTTW